LERRQVRTDQGNSEREFLAGQNGNRGRIVGHISRDSTAIAAREKPVNKKPDVAVPTGSKHKRGAHGMTDLSPAL
jgi:hypothetical protein